MPKATFPYLSDLPAGTLPDSLQARTYRPMLSVTALASNGESVRWLALVDSGADTCLFPLGVAVLLKLNLKLLARGVTSGVGNQVNVTYYETLTIDLGFGIIFTSLVGFTEGMNGAGFGLLGQAGFFENYDVTFARRKNIFTVERV